MADALRCGDCGWQETDHLGLIDPEGEGYEKLRPGYHVKLFDCLGFRLSRRGGAINKRIQAERRDEIAHAARVFESRRRLYESWLGGEMPIFGIQINGITL